MRTDIRISVVPHPANADTRFLSFEAFDDPKALELVEAINKAWDEGMQAAEREEKAAARAERKSRPLHIATFELD